MNRPTPTALKLLKGNPGHRPLPEGEPTPSGDVVIPEFVQGVALKIWHQYAPSLEAQGVLTAWDVDMFGAWCCLMAEFHRKPHKITTPRIAQMRALASCFGLTPADRTRIKTSGKQQSEDPAAKFFA